VPPCRFREFGARKARKFPLIPTQKPNSVLAPVKRWLLGISMLFCKRRAKKTVEIPAMPPKRALLTGAARAVVFEGVGTRGAYKNSTACGASNKGRLLSGLLDILLAD
jgi:hypothetical protein